MIDESDWSRQDLDVDTISGTQLHPSVGEWLAHETIACTRNVAVNDTSKNHLSSVWRLLERLKYKLRAQHNTQSYILTFSCGFCSQITLLQSHVAKTNFNSFHYRLQGTLQDNRPHGKVRSLPWLLKSAFTVSYVLRPTFYQHH